MSGVIEGEISLVVAQCSTCARFRPDGSCEAFDVIPDAILDNEVSHMQPYEGDNGLTYKAR